MADPYLFPPKAAPRWVTPIELELWGFEFDRLRAEMLDLDLLYRETPFWRPLLRRRRRSLWRLAVRCFDDHCEVGV